MIVGKDECENEVVEGMMMELVFRRSFDLEDKYLQYQALKTILITNGTVRRACGQVRQKSRVFDLHGRSCDWF